MVGGGVVAFKCPLAVPSHCPCLPDNQIKRIRAFINLVFLSLQELINYTHSHFHM